MSRSPSLILWGKPLILSSFDRIKETQDKEIMFCHSWTCSKYIHLAEQLGLHLAQTYTHFLSDIFQNIGIISHHKMITRMEFFGWLKTSFYSWNKQDIIFLIWYQSETSAWDSAPSSPLSVLPPNNRNKKKQATKI